MTMLYKLGGTMEWEGDSYSYIVVKEDDVHAKLSEGWHLHPHDCLIDNSSAPTREEMEAKAKELGIRFNHKTSDESLLKKIEDALHELE